VTGDNGHDRLDDLSVGDRLAERDRTHPEPVERPEVPRSSNKYAWAVGIVALMLLGVLLFAQTIPNRGEGLRGPEPGSRLKAFAAPSALGPLEGDANVCQREPCPDQAGAEPACELVSEQVVNLCELRKGPLVLTFIFDRGADCYPQVDRTERLKDDLPGVQFATVFFSRKDRDEIRRLVQARRWTQPVGVDEDGAVANLYGVGGCPTTIFARPGGRVLDTELGNVTEDELRRKAERLTQ
jgi:AhpC/TSA family